MKLLVNKRISRLKSVSVKHEDASLRGFHR